MKKTLLWALLFVVCASFAAGCSSARYVIVTSDYGTHVTTDKPKLDPATDQFSFKDADGNMVSIPRSQIKQVKQVQ